MSIFNDFLCREITSNRDRVYQMRNIVGSKYLIERYDMQFLLEGHTGCVNTVLFSEDGGNFIYTGSDDTDVNIYATETGDMAGSFSTVHTNNIFYAKDLPGTNMEVVLTCAADGRVAITNVETNSARRIYRHRGRAHRIGLVPTEPNQFYSCGEDGVCCLFDLRDGGRTLFGTTPSSSMSEYGSDGVGGTTENMVTPSLKTHFKNNRGHKCSIYTVGVNPYRPYQVAVGGSSCNISIYDSRRFSDPVSFLCPDTPSILNAHVTGLKYDHTGELLIGSYNDDDVYSFVLADHCLPERRCRVSAATSTSTCRKANRSGSLGGDPAGMEYERESGGKCSVDNTPERSNGKMSSSETRRSRSNSVLSTGSTKTTGITTNLTNRCIFNSIAVNDDIDTSSRGYYRQYAGHRNSNTVKQVSFLGARCEYVVSGSDCGHIFIWDKHSAKVVQMLHADKAGAINCLAAHPTLPILATSGLEHNAKVWAPIGDHQPVDVSDLEDGEDVPGSNEKRQRVERVSHRNLQREPSSAYSSGLLSLLVGLLGRDDVFIGGASFGDSDDEEGDAAAVADDDGDDHDNDDNSDDGEDSENNETAERGSRAQGDAGSNDDSVSRSVARARRRVTLLQLARMIPGLLGRRSRSMRGGGGGGGSGSEDEYDQEEDDDDDDDDDDGDNVYDDAAASEEEAAADDIRDSDGGAGSIETGDAGISMSDNTSRSHCVSPQRATGCNDDTPAGMPIDASDVLISDSVDANVSDTSSTAAEEEAAMMMRAAEEF